MRSWPDRQWQYTCAVRSRGSCRGKIPPRCVPGRQSVAGFALHASQKRPRAGKSPAPGKICAPCVIRGARAAKRAPSWQDIHVVYPPTAICRAFRMNGAHILPKPARFEYTAAIYCHKGALSPSEAAFGMHGAQNLPRIAARERISRAFCHRRAPGNAPRRNLVAARHSGTHRASILPLPVRPRAH